MKRLTARMPRSWYTLGVGFFCVAGLAYAGAGVLADPNSAITGAGVALLSLSTLLLIERLSRY